MRHPPKVLIAVPAQDHCATWFAYDWARLAAYTVAQSNVHLTMAVCKTAYLPSSRHLLAESAVESGATHVLWLDSDMRVPKDALLRLLAHNVPIVAASYSMRRVPLAPVASDTFDQTAPHHVAPGATGLEEVAMVGMGCMLVQTDVFRALPKPWFANPWDGRDYVGEDVYFCRLAKEHGYRVVIDAALTQDVGHLGEWEFTHAQLTEWTERKRAYDAMREDVTTPEAA